MTTPKLNIHDKKSKQTLQLLWSINIDLQSLNLSELIITTQHGHIFNFKAFKKFERMLIVTPQNNHVVFIINKISEEFLNNMLQHGFIEAPSSIKNIVNKIY